MNTRKCLYKNTNFCMFYILNILFLLRDATFANIFVFKPQAQLKASVSSFIILKIYT